MRTFFYFVAEHYVSINNYDFMLSKGEHKNIHHQLLIDIATNEVGLHCPIINIDFRGVPITLIDYCKVSQALRAHRMTWNKKIGKFRYKQ